MKITKRDLQISMALIGVLAAAFSYFFVFTKLQAKTEVILAENVTLEQQATFLESIALQKEQYLESTEDLKEEANAIINTYASGYTREDSIMYLFNLEKGGISDAFINNISMDLPQPVVLGETDPLVIPDAQATPDATQTPVTGESMEAVPQTSVEKYTPKIVDNGIALYKVPTTIGFVVSYSGFKNVIDYIYGIGGRKSVDTVTVAFDNTTGKLTCNAMMNTYFMTGTERIYLPESIPSMSTGNENIFKTVETGNVVPEVVQQEEVAE